MMTEKNLQQLLSVLIILSCTNEVMPILVNRKIPLKVAFLEVRDG